MAKAKAQAADTLIGTVSRVKREEIRVTVRQSQGKKWLDLRIFYEDETGTMRPSQRGISLSSDEWVKLREVLKKLIGKGGRAEGRASTQPSD